MQVRDSALYTALHEARAKAIGIRQRSTDTAQGAERNFLLRAPSNQRIPDPLEYMYPHAPSHITAQYVRSDHKAPDRGKVGH